MTTKNEGTARQDIAEMLWDHDTAMGNFRSDMSTYDARADIILAAGYHKPRTITTMEELDALPDGAVIVDVNKNAHRALKRTNGTNWWNAALTYTDSTAIALPATLLGVAAND